MPPRQDRATCGLTPQLGFGSLYEPLVTLPIRVLMPARSARPRNPEAVERERMDGDKGGMARADSAVNGNGKLSRRER